MAKSSFFSGTGTNSTDVDSITSSKAAAETAATNAATSETNAASSASSASTSASNAVTSASNASNSATAAATSETNAASSATAASTSQTSANNSATAAATSATNAATSEANASTSATNAASSATASAASAVSAATSLSNIGASETNAANSATAAATSETNAATSATNAATSETNAATSATTASTAAANASTSETNAATSETNAATSETNAATSETNAATSATSASTSATNAATSASAASASQVSAAASAASAANSYDLFDDRYLGTKTSDPTVDNDGNALVAGALYFNSSANEMRVYDGANWIAASSAGGASLLEYKYTATSGQTTFSGADDNSNSLSYTQDNLIVTLNGVVLENGTDYTATTGTSVVLASGAATSDELNVIAFKTFTTADMVAASTGGTFYGNVAMDANLTFGDNDKAIFGAGSDLQIYHDGSNSYIEDAGTGWLLLKGNDSGIAAQDGSGNYVWYANQNGFGAYYNNSVKLATTSTGVDITGTLTSDGLTVDGNARIEEIGAIAKLTLERGGTANSADSAAVDMLETNAGSEGANFGDLGTNGFRLKLDGSANDFLIQSATANVVNTRFGIDRDTGDISFYEDTGTTPKFFWDASAESLGIGTSSPETTLEVKSTGSSIAGLNSHILVSDETAMAANVGGSVLFEGNYTTGGDDAVFAGIKSLKENGTSGNYAGALAFYSRANGSLPAERMRIDSSGNLLVGKTATTVSTDGFEVLSGGHLAFTRNNDTPVFLNRRTSDGSIIDFRKDNSTVGSIGNDGNDFYVTGSVSNIAGVSFANSKMMPMKSGSTADGQSDLGSSSYRWRDLYLSGGVYLGGTGSANKLDDYEEGTWSPASGSGSNPLSVMGTGNRYTKIGRQVIAYFDITWNSGNSTASAANITGLPFTPSSNHEGDGAATIGYITGSAGVDFVAHVSNSNPSFNFYPDGSSGSANYSALAGRRIAGYVQYYTNA